jgi:hypothetical protein
MRTKFSELTKDEKLMLAASIQQAAEILCDKNPSYEFDQFEICEVFAGGGFPVHSNLIYECLQSIGGSSRTGWNLRDAIALLKQEAAKAA